MSLLDYSLIMSAVRLSVISEIDVNNGCILIYAVVTHILATTDLALGFQETGSLSCSTCQQVHISFSLVDVTSNAVPTVLDRIHIGDSCWATEVSQSLPGKAVL